MEKEKTLKKILGFVHEINMVSNKIKVGQIERRAMICRLNKDFAFVSHYRLTDKVMGLIIKEVEPEVKRLIQGEYEQK